MEGRTTAVLQHGSTSSLRQLALQAMLASTRRSYDKLDNNARGLKAELAAGSGSTDREEQLQDIGLTWERKGIVEKHKAALGSFISELETLQARNLVLSGCATPGSFLRVRDLDNREEQVWFLASVNPPDLEAAITLEGEQKPFMVISGVPGGARNAPIYDQLIGKGKKDIVKDAHGAELAEILDVF